LIGAAFWWRVDKKDRLVMVERVGGTNNQPWRRCKTGINAESDVVESAVSNRPSSFGKFTPSRHEGKDSAEARIESRMGLGRKKVQDASSGSIRKSLDRRG
jgi:hypothetical protein